MSEFITAWPGEFWKILKKLKKPLKSTDKIDTILSIDEQTGPLAIINNLNDFFVNIGLKLASKIETGSLTKFNDWHLRQQGGYRRQADYAEPSLPPEACWKATCD